MGFFKNKNKGPSPKLALKGLRFFSPAPRHALLIVSIDDGWMKCVCGQGHPKKRKVQFLWAEPIHGWSEEQVSTRLKVLLHEHGIAHAHILIAHASHLSRARALRLPSVNREEIKTMVDLQVEKHTPDAKEETLTYFRILEATEQGYSNVLLVMAHQDAVAHSARIAQKLSAKSIKVGSDIEGLIRWYQQFIQLEKQGREGGTLLLDIDAEHSTLMIFHGGEAYYHRTIPLKIEDLTQDSSGEVVSQFVGEVHQ